MMAIVLHFVVVACMANNRKFTSNCLGENANDFCRFCCVNLKMKLSDFQKNTERISTEVLFKFTFRSRIA